MRIEEKVEKCADTGVEIYELLRGHSYEDALTILESVIYHLISSLETMSREEGHDDWIHIRDNIVDDMAIRLKTRH